MLSPLLYSLYSYDCNPVQTIIKFADDTTVIGLITGGDEMGCRDEVQQLTSWSSANNLTLNTSKTKELVTDFREVQGFKVLYYSSHTQSYKYNQ